MSNHKDTAPPGSRRQGRERVLGLLYEAETKGIGLQELIVGLPLPLQGYGAQLAAGFGDDLTTYDPLIDEASHHWAVDRMPALDRALLRMATFELAERADVPAGAVISEAVELAADYSTDGSSKFVNGVLSRWPKTCAPMSPRPDGSPSQPSWPALPLPAPHASSVAGLSLGLWKPRDAGALRAAWADPDVSRWMDVPEADAETATRWIEGDEQRRARGVALDLVVSVDGVVAGEVGFSSFQPARRACLVGYWVAAEHRGQGLGGRALHAATEWFITAVDAAAVLAVCDAENIASHRTATAAGFATLGKDRDGNVVFLRSSTR